MRTAPVVHLLRRHRPWVSMERTGQWRWCSTVGFGETPRRPPRVPDSVEPSEAVRIAKLSTRRATRRNSRYSLASRAGRYIHQRALEMLRTRIDPAKLSVREQYDLMQAEKRRAFALQQAQRHSKLPRFFSAEFECKYYFREEDLIERSTKGRGPGGQATNKRMQTCELSHAPTGIHVRVSKFPSLWANRKMARKLLDLRIEQRYLGTESRLGQERALIALRKRRMASRRKHLALVADVSRDLTAEDRNLSGMLCEDRPLPRVVVDELRCCGALLTPPGPLRVSDFFNALCSDWWPLLSLPTASAAAAGGESSGVVVVVPQWFMLVFPTGDAGMPPTVRVLEPRAEASDAERGEACGTHEQGPEDDSGGSVSPPVGVSRESQQQTRRAARAARKRAQRVARQRARMERAMAQRLAASVERCRTDPAAIANVRRALSCFLECFGLRLGERRARGASADGAARDRLPLIVEADGANWDERCGRLLVRGAPGHAQPPARLAPLPRALLQRVFESLGWMGLAAERDALRVFAVRQRAHERKTGRGAGDAAMAQGPCGWGTDLCRALARVERREQGRDGADGRTSPSSPS